MRLSERRSPLDFAPRDLLGFLLPRSASCCSCCIDLAELPARSGKGIARLRARTQKQRGSSCVTLPWRVIIGLCFAHTPEPRLLDGGKAGMPTPTFALLLACWATSRHARSRSYPRASSIPAVTSNQVVERRIHGATRESNADCQVVVRRTRPPYDAAKPQHAGSLSAARTSPAKFRLQL